MRKNFSKVMTTLVVSAAMLAMVGCSKETPKTNTDNPGSNGTESPVESDTTDKTLADYEKASSFKYFNIAAGVETDALNSSIPAQMVKEHTGYDVYYDQSPADPTDAESAITNIFMLKSDYQAVKVTKAQFYTLLEMGALSPITEYVKGSTYLKDVISEFGWETATKENEIYGIPQKDARLTNITAIAFRLDWLNEYNAANPDAQLSVPSEANNYSMTLSDFKTMLTYFATKVPEGGKALAVDTSGVYLENILPAFGIYHEWADVNGEAQYVINQPGFTEYMAYMEDLFDSGLIQYQATANDAGAVKSLQAKTVGAGRIPHWSAVTIESTETTTTDENISYIAALVPDDRKDDASAVRVFASEGYSYYTVIPNFATAEQAAAVVDFADKKLEPEFFLKLVLGTEGETFTIENGDYYPILPAFDEKQNLADKFMDGIREDEYAKYWLCRTRKTEAQNKMFSIANFNINNVGMKSLITVMPPNSLFDTAFSGINLEVKDALVKTFYQAEVNTSLEDIQSIYQGMSGDDVTGAVNEWYTSWESKDTFNAVKAR